MISFFRKIRLRSFGENKFSKYLLYATGEIVLVVLGILIALQINIKNDQRKDRDKEIHYLNNITADLKINIAEMDRYLKVRNEGIEASQTILEHFDGKPIEDYDAFNGLGISIYDFKKFYQNNNTFQELVNSGNLAFISNDNIKNQLLNIESLYKQMKSEEDHYRFDIEELIYKPLYTSMDLTVLVNRFEYYLTGNGKGKDIVLSKDFFAPYLENNMLKNGFMMTILEFGIMNGQMEDMKAMSEELLGLIEQEVKR